MSKVYNIRQAMEANADFFGFDLCDTIDLGDGGEPLEIMYRELLDAPTKSRVDLVYKEHETCDRQKIEVTDDEGKVTTMQGGFIEPRLKNGELFDLERRVSVALWGEENYQRFLTAGGPPGLVLMTWGRMRTQIQRRQLRDSKSN